MSQIPIKLKSILEDLREIDDPQTRMDLLIEFGEKYTPVPESLVTKPYPEINKVMGCESDAYVFPIPRDNGTIDFYFAVENPHGISAKALAYVLQSSLSGEPLEDVAEVSEEIAYQMFGRSLSMGKGLGLTSMIRMVKDIAKS